MITISLNDLTFYINNKAIERELGEIEQISDNKVRIIHKGGGSWFEIHVTILEKPLTEKEAMGQASLAFTKERGHKLQKCSFKKFGDRNMLFISINMVKKKGRNAMALWYPWARPGWIEGMGIKFSSTMRESFTIEMLKSIQIDKTSDKNITEENNSNLEDSINPISEN